MSKSNVSVKVEATNQLLEGLDRIDSEYQSASQRSSHWRKLANSIKKKLRKELSLNTVHNYTTLLNNEVKETGRKHHGLTSPTMRKGYLSKSIKDLPEYENELRAVADMPATTINLGKAELLDKVKKLDKGELRTRAIAVVDGLLTDHAIISYLGKSKEEKLDRTDNQERSLDYKSINVKVYNPQPLIDLAIECLDDDSYTAVTWGLALLTGRRSTEIVYHAKFEAIDSNTVLFSGQSKKRQGVKTAPYPIPVLTDSGVIIKALKKLRKMPEVSIFRTGDGKLDGEDVHFPDLSKLDLNRAINQRVSTVLNDRAKRLVSDKAEVFKNTRNFYARYCWDVARLDSDRWEGFNEDAFLKAILGHVSPKEVRHYRQVELKSEPSKEWLKVPEPEEEKEEEDTEPKQKAKRNRRATAGFADMGALVNGHKERFVHTSSRKVKIKNVQVLHKDLSTWAAENPTLKITQTVVTKNKGNTIESGTGSVDLKANRYTFQAWVQVIGEDRLNTYNDGKD